MNWATINDRFQLCIISKKFKCVNNRHPVYIYIFKPTGHPNTNIRTSFLKLNQTLRETNHGKKALSLFSTKYLEQSTKFSQSC